MQQPASILSDLSDLECISIADFAKLLGVSRSQGYVIARGLPAGSIVAAGPRLRRIRVKAARAYIEAGGQGEGEAA